MEPEAIRDYYTIDGDLKDTNDLDIFYKIKNQPIYEAIRIIDKVPLFLEEHLERMRKSADLMGIDIHRKNDEIKKDINKLISKNKVENLNIKLLCVSLAENQQVFLVYFIDSFYPSKEYYREGIHTILYNYERENPNAKILMTSFRQCIGEKLKENNAFEALLINRDGHVTEGSRSNIFFLMDKKLYTSPTGAVLLGITRKYIMEVCKELNIELVEENIHLDNLNRLEGAFMSGTSVDVLPISTIENIKLESINNHIIKQVMDGYKNKMKLYIESKTL